MAKLTAETITDEQMSALVRDLKRDVDTAGYARLDLDCRTETLRADILKARARCAEILNDRESRLKRQHTVHDWCVAAFGREHATSIQQRGLRMLEEAIELFQACDGDPKMAHKLVDFVFARPKGTIGQELGGIGVTTLALAAAAFTSADDEERREVERVLAKPLEHFTKRNEAKNAAGFVVAAPERGEGGA